MECSVAAEFAAAADHVVLCVQPSSAPWWTYLPSFLTAIVATAALLTARQSLATARETAHNTLESSRKIARDKATLDLIEKRESTEYYRKIHRTFAELRQGRGFGHLGNPVDADDPNHKDAKGQPRVNASDQQDVIDYLNHYELVSIGIRLNLLDASTYRGWMEGPFVRDWNAAAEWIQRERWEFADRQWHYRASIFQFYQMTALSWSPDATSLTDTSGNPPDRPGGIGDVPLPAPIDTVMLGDRP